MLSFPVMLMEIQRALADADYEMQKQRVKIQKEKPRIRLCGVGDPNSRAGRWLCESAAGSGRGETPLEAYCDHQLYCRRYVFDLCGMTDLR